MLLVLLVDNKVGLLEAGGCQELRESDITIFSDTPHNRIITLTFFMKRFDQTSAYPHMLISRLDADHIDPTDLPMPRRAVYRVSQAKDRLGMFLLNYITHYKANHPTPHFSNKTQLRVV
jgi:hypothetical protein